MSTIYAIRWNREYFIKYALNRGGNVSKPLFNKCICRYNRPFYMIKNAQTMLENVHYDVHHASPLAKFDITISLNCNKWKYLVALFRSLSLFHVKQAHTHESCNALNTFFGIWGRKRHLTILYFIEQWNQMSPAFMRNYHLLALSTSCWSTFLHTLMTFIIIFFFILNVCLA